MKKLLFGAFLGMFAVAGVAVLPNYVSADDDDQTEDQVTTAGWANPDSNKNLINGSQELKGAALLTTIQNAINWILGILATIALVVCLYGGFKMVTAAGDEKKYQDGLKVLKYAAIGLAIVGLSWMIVSVIFWFVNTLGGSGTTQSGNLNTTDGGSKAFGSTTSS